MLHEINADTAIARAVRILASSDVHGFTPVAVQTMTGMSRRLSRWDMKRLALAYHMKVVRKPNSRGTVSYRFAAKSPASR